MRVEVLGCSGGIGGSARTTSLRVEREIVIDAGTGLAELPLNELQQINYVFLTHSHLDHIACLPLMLDSVGERDHSVVVYGLPQTVTALRAHIFNNQIWPDFTRLPSPERPFIVLKELPAKDVVIGNIRLRAVPANHVVPAVGYLISGPNGTVAFSGDTTTNEAYWQAVNACRDLRYVIIETTFMDEDAELAGLAKHLCPSLLATELAKYRGQAPVYITHLMPGAEEDIMREIGDRLPENTPRRLTRGQVLTL